MIYIKIEIERIDNRKLSNKDKIFIFNHLKGLKAIKNEDNPKNIQFYEKKVTYEKRFNNMQEMFNTTKQISFDTEFLTYNTTLIR